MTDPEPEGAGPYPNPFEGVTECIAHSAHIPLDDGQVDCDWCRAELEAKEKVLEALLSDASGLEADIDAMGAGISPVAALGARLSLLIDVVFKDPRQRMHFEAEYLRRVKEQLEEAKRQVMRAKLQAGVAPFDLKNLKGNSHRG